MYKILGFSTMFLELARKMERKMLDINYFRQFSYMITSEFPYCIFIRLVVATPLIIFDENEN